MYDEDFTIPYVIDKTPNSLASRQLPTLAKKNAWTIYINGEEPITSQGTLDELQTYQTQRGNTRSISVYA